jgi:hypothetical protein
LQSDSLTKYKLKEEQLIFIISQPRSGSTYLQRLLSNNPKVNTCSEPWLLLQFANQIKPALLSAGFNNTLANDAFQDYLAKFPELDFKTAIKQLILKLYGPMALGYEYVIDKTPRYWELVEELPKLFPKSKIIILKRHPIDVLRSIIKTWDKDTVISLGEYANDLMLAPKKIQEFAEAQADNPNVKMLTYEALIQKPGETIQPLYAWLGLPYTDSVLQTEGNTKIKGKYGDPFQNAAETFENAREKSRNKKVSTAMEEFIVGYANFLTPEFLRDYGDYKITVARPTQIFNDFLDSQRPAAKLYAELAYVKHSTSFKLGSTLLGPYRFWKRMFK